jgi:hypothetical protein
MATPLLNKKLPYKPLAVNVVKKLHADKTDTQMAKSM